MEKKYQTKEDLEHRFTNLLDLIDKIELSETKRTAFKTRYLDQVLWFDGHAEQTQILYYLLRLTTIVGGVLIPSLVSFYERISWLHWVVFSVSLIVAISSAVEGFFHYGERWRNYRRTAEELKMEGWLFIQLAGRYGRKKYLTHEDAFPDFAGRVEDIIRQELNIYITQIVGEQDLEKSKKSSA
ncbi:MAG: DUF4231 domain-containing protein [Chloroflexota bacterium]